MRVGFFLKDFTSEKVKGKDYVMIEWYVEYEKPNKFLIEQIAWAEGVADRWITCGKKHFFQIGGWLEDPDGGWRNEINKFLTLEKYINIMKANVVESAEKYRNREMELFVLRYTPKDMKAFMDVKNSDNMNYQVELWFDKEFMIVAASVRIKDGQKTDIEYRQLFAGYNRKFDIKEPEDVIQ